MGIQKQVRPLPVGAGKLREGFPFCTNAGGYEGFANTTRAGLLKLGRHIFLGLILTGEQFKQEAFC